ncbi:hypothetical protein GALMADRAFT_224955 [Galerina marginata CBS 339.88]|uniref:Uncharacterized protein n=1 Tax=Galerina marginata (strain CBS 339.88) TaxID=685588 RepID=A0A067TFE9_GALM3|nr:hypothetical protein GALMADRAFT_224955 [Galerina marginata CBS 339.88]
MKISEAKETLPVRAGLSLAATRIRMWMETTFGPMTTTAGCSFPWTSSGIVGKLTLPKNDGNPDLNDGEATASHSHHTQNGGSCWQIEPTPPVHTSTSVAVAGSKDCASIASLPI